MPRTGWIRSIALLAMLAGLSSCASNPPPSSTVPALRLTSPDFADGGVIPNQFTCKGTGISPGLDWQAPAKAQSFVLMVSDIDSPLSFLFGHFVHWLVYDVPPSARSLSEATPKVRQLPNTARQGINGFDELGYAAPCPPGNLTHRYVFTLYALDAKLDLPSGATKKQLDSAIEGHVIGEGQLTGSFP